MKKSMYNKDSNNTIISVDKDAIQKVIEKMTGKVITDMREGEDGKYYFSTAPKNAYLEEIGVPQRTCSALHRLSIYMVREVTENFRSLPELRYVFGIGEKGANELMECISVFLGESPFVTTPTAHMQRQPRKKVDPVTAVKQKGRKTRKKKKEVA